jgi:hypothetical protein
MSGTRAAAIVLVPEAEPMPATATAVLEAFGNVPCGSPGETTTRYRSWLRISRGRGRGRRDRPAVRAPRDLGLI